MADLATSGQLDRPTGPYGRARSGLDILVMLAAAASALTAAWVLIVTTTVLPRRDPSGIPFWTAVAAGFLAYAGLTAVYLRLGRRSGVVRAAAALASVAAVAIGGSWIIGMLMRSGDFEGYVVLMGAILAGHGATVLLHGIADGRREPDPLRASRRRF